MKKYISIYLYGVITILSGIFLLFSENSSLTMIRFTLGITLTIGAVFAFIAAVARRRRQVQFAYHELHALAMLLYGAIILLFCNTFERLTQITSFLFIFYTFSEIIFCNWLFNLEQKVDYKILFIRVFLGLAVGIGTIFALNFTDYTLVVFGVLFILIGINIVLYVPILKGRQFNDVTKKMSE